MQVVIDTTDRVKHLNPNTSYTSQNENGQSLKYLKVIFIALITLIRITLVYKIICRGGSKDKETFELFSFHWEHDDTSIILLDLKQQEPVICRLLQQYSLDL
jgi:hypothetical protein